MNSCILMAQVVRDPELRSTQDQTSVATMLVEFESTREGEAPTQVKVEGWGNLAEEMNQTYRLGNQIIIEGRLSMNTIEMDGYKQKVAKLVASRIFPVTGMSSSANNNAPSDRQADNVVSFAAAPQPQAEPAYTAPAPDPAPIPEPAPAPASSGNEDWDEIPF